MDGLTSSISEFPLVHSGPEIDEERKTSKHIKHGRQVSQYLEGKQQRGVGEVRPVRNIGEGIWVKHVRQENLVRL